MDKFFNTVIVVEHDEDTLYAADHIIDIGPGAGVGLAVGEVNYFALSAAGMVGIEYNFNIPLQISLDFRQHVGIGFKGNGLYTPSSIGLGIRYKF